MSSTTRRTFLKQAATATLAGLSLSSVTAERKAPKAATVGDQPWYRRTLRWGQTNITEIDPTRYDIAWWRQHWKQTHTQGVIINAGGIVAYYPSPDWDYLTPVASWRITRAACPYIARPST